MLRLQPLQSLHTASPPAQASLGSLPLQSSCSWASKLVGGASQTRSPDYSQRRYTPIPESLPTLLKPHDKKGHLVTSTFVDMSKQAIPSALNHQYPGFNLMQPQNGYVQAQAEIQHHGGLGSVGTQHALHQNHHNQASSGPPSRPESPVFQTDEQNAPSRRGSHQGGIVSYLQIPSTISPSKGSLAEFAAQITCLFWFESSTTLASIEISERSPVPTARLVAEASPPLGFLKWVTTILSTTQVTQNVILLALLFIYRLKKQNPSVKGKPGSEYRLLTVALMLANKFLDDNTYTNLTWAEVSGISVQEIHVMEVEFLSHMKYNLYTSKESWYEWHRSLGKFWTYFDRASRTLADVGQAHIGSRPAALQTFTLPSPPASTNHSPPYGSALSPTSNGPYNATLMVLPPNLALPSLSPTSPKHDLDLRRGSRKRSVDESNVDPPAKRPSGYQSDLDRSRRSSVAAHHQSMSRFQAPSLPALAPVTQSLSRMHTPTSGRTGTLTPISAERSSQSQALPPFSWSSGTPSLTAQLATPSAGHSSYVLPVNQHPQYASSASHTAAQTSLSPSHFLHQRSSPYRPVRNMSTLLVPPPSNQVPQSTGQIAYDQMHWQPLAKSQNERHTGRVPYLHHEAWPATHQVENWPSLYSVHGYN